jgi:hypothetical protein
MTTHIQLLAYLMTIVSSKLAHFVMKYYLLLVKSLPLNDNKHITLVFI